MNDFGIKTYLKKGKFPSKNELERIARRDFEILHKRLSYANTRTVQCCECDFEAVQGDFAFGCPRCYSRLEPRNFFDVLPGSGSFLAKLLEILREK